MRGKVAGYMNKLIDMEWLDSEWMPANTCGLVIFLVSMAISITLTQSGLLLAPSLLSTKRYSTSINFQNKYIKAIKHVLVIYMVCF